MTTRSFKVKNGLIIGSSTEVTSIVDEDTMTSNSATALATQQSIKAYVDTQTAAAGLLTVIGDDSSAASVTIENDDLKIAGGANITTSGSGDTLTAALDAALTGLTSVQIDSLNLQDNTITTDSNADLTLAPGGTGDINLTAGADINVPANIGMTFGNDGEKIEGNGTNLTIASSGLCTITATGNTVVTNNLLVSGTTTLTGALAIGDLNILSDGSITTDSNGDLDLAPAGTGDINLTAGADVNIPADIGLTFGNDGEKIEGDGTDLTIASSGALNINNTGTCTVSGALTVTGNLTVNGTTTTNNSVNTTIADNMIELNSGISSSGNDIGFIFERGSTGNNACIIWDESADKFAMGTTTATAADKSGGITFSTATVQATATAAQYSDVAERYHADAIYPPGTVVKIGGDNEITVNSGEAGDTFFGVVSSTNTAAFMMNDVEGYSDSTHPFICMTGRIPTRVTGAVGKGAKLIQSSTPGVARQALDGEANSSNTIGRSLESTDAEGESTVLAVCRINL